MGPEIVIPLGAFATAIICSIGIPLARAYARRMDADARNPRIPTEVAGRLERIEQAIATVGALARPAENAQAPETLLSRYSMVRQFLPLLLDTITPHATTGGKAILAALEFLHRIERTASPPTPWRFSTNSGPLRRASWLRRRAPVS